MLVLESDLHEVWGDRYTYKADEFPVTKRSNITILCKKHGIFTQRIDHHIAGHGCPECGRLAVKEYRTMAFVTFVGKAHERHGQAYEYDAESYTICSNPVTITCSKHGVFQQIGSAHLSGHKCPGCAKEGATYSTEQFISKANEVHGDHYTYKDTVYIKSTVKVAIGCRIHGNFLQEPRQHLSGEGCPECGNYRKSYAGAIKRDVPTKLYVVYIPELHVWKVGWTSQTIARRLRPLAFEILYCNLLPTTGIANIFEKQVLKATLPWKIQNTEYKHIAGHTEMRIVNPMDILEVQNILQEIKEKGYKDANDYLADFTVA